MTEQFYDVVDSTGTVVETVAQQFAEAVASVVIKESEKPLSKSTRKRLAKLNRRKGAQLRKQYVTVQHPRVVTCAHRLDLTRQPRHRNCEHCWFAWFNTHGEVVQQLDEMHTKGDTAAIVALQGRKFLHRWLQFMATVARFKFEQQEYEDTNQETAE